MKTKQILTFESYVALITNDGNLSPYEIALYRGQTARWPLLPSIARGLKNENLPFLLDDEKRALAALIRRSGMLIARSEKTTWEWLVTAQHYGMHTRLLDWTTNPLTALWFACNDEKLQDVPSYVYRLVSQEYVQEDLPEPFALERTIIYYPKLDNPRISAQAGFFTAFGIYPKMEEFLPLQNDPIYSSELIEIAIMPVAKRKILKILSNMGINHATVFADFEGLCRHLNWEYFGDYDTIT